MPNERNVHRWRSAALRACAAMACILPAMTALAADAHTPHPHQGRVQPFGVPPASVTLTAEEAAVLARGEAVHKQSRGNGGGRGIAVVDVAAEPSMVWATITDIEAYPRMVESMRVASVYARDGDHIKVRFVLGGPGVDIEYFVDHVYRPQQGYMTWTLDYSRKSDMDDSVGYWRVLPHPERPGWSRILYSIEVRVGWWLPGFIEDMLAQDGLKKSTLWVKREAERRSRPQ